MTCRYNAAVTNSGGIMRHVFTAATLALITSTTIGCAQRDRSPSASNPDPVSAPAPALASNSAGASAPSGHAGHAALASGPATRPAALLDGLGKLHHPVSTRNPEAQKFFDQGLTLIYAFNHDEAIRAFQRAAALDPKLAMAHWGIALALGPNYNVPVDPAREKQANAEMQVARRLAADAPLPERDYVEALAARFSGDDQPDLNALAHNYKSAMDALVKKYPDDLDAATLAADAAMNLRPWQLWSRDGKPAEGTPELVALLESVLKRDPDHIGANHLYIHSVEASGAPQRAMESAGRLPGLSPSAGHLVHMPSHIYSRIGDFEAAATSNEAAIAADEAYMAAQSPAGVYPLMYYNHNIHFLAYASAQAGRMSEARAAAEKLAAHARPHIKQMPMLEAFTSTPVMILVRFHRWDDVINTPQPDASMPVTTLAWRFARGCANAGRGDLAVARSERDAFAAALAALPGDTPYGLLNKAPQVLAIGQHVLDARIAEATKDTSAAEAHLRQAIELEDGLTYIEPPDWLLPTREMLGGVLLRAGNYAGAEKVFREDLDRNPRGGRSLFGLCKALEAQNRTYDAERIREQFESVWKNTDMTLKAEDL
jgi:tetratricopeptide (TPR) repeat protein